MTSVTVIFIITVTEEIYGMDKGVFRMKKRNQIALIATIFAGIIAFTAGKKAEEESSAEKEGCEGDTDQ